MRILRSSLAAVAILAVAGSVAPARTQNPVTAPSIAPAAANLDFEAGPENAAPSGWLATTASSGYPAVATADRPHGGKLCVMLRAEHPSSPYGILMESIDAKPYRGHRLRMHGSIRAKDARAQFWVRVDRSQGRMGFFDNGRKVGVEDDAWKNVEMIVDVDEDAESLNFGLLMLGGSGATYLDDVSIEDLGAYVMLAEPPRPLTERGRANLEAFVRLYGLVRFFHPSDEAAAADWNALAVDGVRRVEGAPTPEALARALEETFRSVAPTVRVASGAPAPVPAELTSAAHVPGVKTIEWRHAGYGGGNRGELYSDTRVDAPAGGHDPTHPLAVDLPGGVHAEVAIALFADASGTLPHAPTGAAASAAKPIRYSGGDRTTRLADVAIAWNVLAHFYPYFDVVKTDWDAQLDPALDAAATDTTDEAFTVTLRRMVATLHDGHGGVGGPGVNQTAAIPLTWAWIESRLVVTAVAADVKGISRGDVVESVDGTPALEVVEAIERLTSSATPQWARVRALYELREGLPNTTVALSVRSAGAEPRTVTLTKTAAGVEFEEPRPEKLAEIRPGIWYVDLSHISDDDFKTALPNLADAKGVVFDLRGYPNCSPMPLRHLTDTPLQSARWNVPIVTDPDWRRSPSFSTDGRWNLEPEAPRLKGKIAFLTDGRAISYAESWMGIVEAYHLGAIVGETTAGTNGDINPLALPGGYTIIWTGMKVLKHDGSRHHGVGIAPTVPVSRTVKGIAEGRDEQLERAIEVVGGP